MHGRQSSNADPESIDEVKVGHRNAKAFGVQIVS